MTTIVWQPLQLGDQSSLWDILSTVCKNNWARQTRDDSAEMGWDRLSSTRICSLWRFSTCKFAFSDQNLIVNFFYIHWIAKIKIMAFQKVSQSLIGDEYWIRILVAENHFKVLKRISIHRNRRKSALRMKSRRMFCSINFPLCRTVDFQQVAIVEMWLQIINIIGFLLRHETILFFFLLNMVTIPNGSQLWSQCSFYHVWLKLKIVFFPFSLFWTTK